MLTLLLLFGKYSTKLPELDMKKFLIFVLFSGISSAMLRTMPVLTFGNPKNVSQRSYTKTSFDASSCKCTRWAKDFRGIKLCENKRDCYNRLIDGHEQLHQICCKMIKWGYSPHFMTDELKCMYEIAGCDRNQKLLKKIVKASAYLNPSDQNLDREAILHAASLELLARGEQVNTEHKK